MRLPNEGPIGVERTLPKLVDRWRWVENLRARHRRGGL